MVRQRRVARNQLLSRGALVVAAVVATVIPLRGLFFGKLLGDLGDARWTVSVYEHWFRFFGGHEALGSTLFFFPAQDTLGFSDAFLAPGIVHALLRAMTLDPVTSWSIATCVLIFVGNLGIALLAHQVFRSLSVKLVFVLIAGTTYAFVTQLEHVQTLGYGIFWWIIALYLYGRHGTSKRSRTAWFFVLPVLALGALTSWYPVFFFFMVGAIAVVFTFIFTRSARWVVTPWRRARSLSLTGWVLSLGVTLGLGAAWLLVYVPVLGALRKPWTEYLTYGPHVVDVVNVMGGAGIWWDLVQVLDPTVTPSSAEHAMGIPPILFVSFVVVSLWLLAMAIRRRIAVPTALVVGAITVWATWLVVMIFGEGGFSLFHLLWKFLPGATSIRAAFRVNIVLTVIVLLIVIYVVEKWVLDGNRTHARRHSLRVLGAAVLLCLFFIEQQRPAPTNWTADQFVAPPLRSSLSQLEHSSCTSFLLTEPGPESVHPESWWWLVQVDATALAVSSEIATINGYSGNFPGGYPFIPPTSAESISAYLDWAQGLGLTDTCLVSAGGVRPVELSSPR